MKYLFIILILGLFTLSCSKETLVPSGILTTQTKNISAFSKIEAHSGFDIKISQSNSDKIEIEADNNIIDYVEVFLTESTLMVKLNDNVRIDRPKTVNISIATPELTSLITSGGTKITFLSTFNINTLNVNISGGGSLNGNITSCTKLDCNTTGGSTMELAGKCTLLNLRASGGGDFNSFDLEVETANLTLSGGSNAQLYVTKTMNVVDASGGSKIEYKGDAICLNTNLSGGSTIFKR